MRSAFALALHTAFDDVAPIWREYVASCGHFLVRASPLTEQLYGSVDATNVGAVAVRMLTFRRHVLWAGDHRPADIVAASSSPFPFVRPHKIDGKIGARQVVKESRKWRESTGGETIIVGPTDALLAIKLKGMGDMGDMRIGRQVYELAIPVGRDLAPRLQS